MKRTQPTIVEQNTLRSPVPEHLQQAFGGGEEEDSEEDQLHLELRQLAIQLQKNAGVEIGDRRRNGVLVQSCFTAEQLVEWLTKRFKVGKEMGTCIGMELRMQGLIIAVDGRTAPFYPDDTLYRVAHPYAINLLLLPSQMEGLYEQLRSTQGPKLSERMHGGNRIKECFNSSELVDWLMSVHMLAPRKRAMQVAQQIMDNGYIFDAVTGTDVFHDDKNQLLQHKDDYCNMIKMSPRKRVHVVRRMIQAYDAKVDLEKVRRPMTVRVACELLGMVVEDCSVAKAMYLLGILYKHELILVRTENATVLGKEEEEDKPKRRLCGFLRSTVRGGGGSSFNFDEDTTVLVQLKGEEFDLRRGTGKAVEAFLAAENETQGHGSSMYDDDFLSSEKEIRLTPVPHPEVLLHRNVRLMTHLETSDAEDLDKSSGRSRFERLRFLRKYVHTSLAIVLWFVVLGTSPNVLGTTDGVQDVLKKSAGFQQLYTEDMLIDWVEHEQLGKGLEWMGPGFMVLQQPRVWLAAPLQKPCEDILDSLVQDVLDSTGGFETKAGCDSDSPLPSEMDRADFVSSSTQLVWDPKNLSRQDAVNRPKLDVLREQGSKVAHKHGGLELILLGRPNDVPVAMQVHAVAYFGLWANEVQVRLVPLVTSSLGTVSNALLAFLLVLAMIDWITLAHRDRLKYVMSFVGCANLFRVALATVALVMDELYVSQVQEFLAKVAAADLTSTIALENPDPETDFEQLAMDYNTIRICFVLSMFLTTISLTAMVGGPRYDLYHLLSITLGAVSNEIQVLGITLLANFAAFALALYSLMGPVANEFGDITMTSMTLYGSLFGGSPWNAFRGGRAASPLRSLMGFVFMVSYLSLFIFILLNMFVAILIQSYQRQKAEESFLRSEFTRHLHASGSARGIERLREVISKHRKQQHGRFFSAVLSQSGTRQVKQMAEPTLSATPTARDSVMGPAFSQTIAEGLGYSQDKLTMRSSGPLSNRSNSSIRHGSSVCSLPDGAGVPPELREELREVSQEEEEPSNVEMARAAFSRRTSTSRVMPISVDTSMKPGVVRSSSNEVLDC